MNFRYLRSNAMSSRIRIYKTNYDNYLIFFFSMLLWIVFWVQRYGWWVDLQFSGGVVRIRGAGGEGVGTSRQFLSLGEGGCNKLKSRRFFSKNWVWPPPLVQLGREESMMFLLSLFRYDSGEVVTIFSSILTNTPKSLICLEPSLRAKISGKHGKLWSFGFSFLSWLSC